LKLENIMLEARDSLAIKLVDFGFCEKINLTALVSKAGTPGFIPPEIFHNQPFSEFGDVFSLGVIFYSVIYDFFIIIPLSDHLWRFPFQGQELLAGH
jgi:serine/threonine protein kinase